MTRLSHQIYAGFVLVVLIMVGIVAILGSPLSGRDLPDFVRGTARLVAEQLPEADAPTAEVQTTLERAAHDLNARFTLWSAEGERIASVGAPISGPPEHRSGWATNGLGPPPVVVELSDGRRLGMGPRGLRLEGLFLQGLIALAVAMFVVSYPLSRWIARRLERLRDVVEDLGAGDLDARALVRGRDEVAQLARSFNEAASRIQRLVDGQRRVLASASHELRSPLTRLRMAVALMRRNAPPKVGLEAERDIAELDELVEDILLSARVQSGTSSGEVVPIELSLLLREEASRVGGHVSEGDEVSVRGDAHQIRRMLRNVLENAQRYAGGEHVEAELVSTEQGARIRIQDRGPGVPPHERERVFEPFYRASGHSERRDGGVGLGLSLVREIARRHGGEAVCLPRSGGGTTIEIQLAAEPSEP